MKKTILFYLTILLLTINLNAQTTKGNWMFGGAGDYSHFTTKNDLGTTSKYSTITINPNFAYFIKDNWAIGGNLNYRNYSSNYFGNSNSYGLGILTRYYFLKPTKIYNFFAQANFIYSVTHADLTGYSQFYITKIGSVIFLNNSIGIEFSIQYEKEINDVAKNSVIKAGIGIQIHLQKK
jgi:hypothetical protein